MRPRVTGVGGRGPRTRARESASLALISGKHTQGGKNILLPSASAPMGGTQQAPRRPPRATGARRYGSRLYGNLVRGVKA